MFNAKRTSLLEDEVRLLPRLISEVLAVTLLTTVKTQLTKGWAFSPIVG